MARVGRYNPNGWELFDMHGWGQTAFLINLEPLKQPRPMVYSK